MPKFIDLTNEKYGRLTVLERADNIGRLTAWHCVCECGSRKVVLAGHLRMERIVSCGCYKKENSTIKATKHGHWGTKLHRVWLSMRQRCNNPKNKSYKDYGGRGINVCAEWSTFSVFEDWSFKNGYREGLTIERINVNSGYRPENYTWIPKSEQSKNTRKTLNKEFYKKD